MSYLKQLKSALPVAPLKLMVLNSAAELGNEINNYLVSFRNKVTNVYNNDPAFQGYVEKTICFNSVLLVFIVVKAKLCWTRLYAEKMFLFL